MINVKVCSNPVNVNSNAKVIKGDKGTTFTPYVDELSNLSWSNDGGLPNPPTRNIRGKDGEASITPISNRDIERIMGG